MMVMIKGCERGKQDKGTLKKVTKSFILFYPYTLFTGFDFCECHFVIYELRETSKK